MFKSSKRTSSYLYVKAEGFNDRKIALLVTLLAWHFIRNVPKVKSQGRIPEKQEHIKEKECIFGTLGWI